jgi:hypothetical protein
MRLTSVSEKLPKSLLIMICVHVFLVVTPYSPLKRRLRLSFRVEIYSGISSVLFSCCKEDSRLQNYTVSQPKGPILNIIVDTSEPDNYH